MQAENTTAFRKKHTNKRVAYTVKKEVEHTINQGRRNSVCVSLCRSRSRLKLLAERRRRRANEGGPFRCSASWSRKWQTSSNKWNYQHILCLQKWARGREKDRRRRKDKEGRKNETNQTSSVGPKRGHNARCSGEFLYNCQRLGTRTGRKSRWHYTFIRRHRFTLATITSFIASTQAIIFGRIPGKFIIYRFFGSTLIRGGAFTVSADSPRRKHIFTNYSMHTPTHRTIRRTFDGDSHFQRKPMRNLFDRRE